ncbi:hypothetical protein Pla123a_19660 [Posidoniimonas polymericola]|uniref:Uncharacterized protein n=1 Tax=Posidoniimonas polymericola TaxID=2528002 RepID=A0A5C5YR57_9BACT|nr:hypothetical protein [Posidoniimonas polymericola]TWT77308.1 hypothetical protein Pla123a_19660 [Posidoniimonas polymericola]
MVERRSLVEGISGAKPEDEKEFVYGEEPSAKKSNSFDKHSQPKILPQMASRVPITTRARPEIASALKRASLERQLSGEQPFYVQEILEEALDAWLRSRGFL